MIRNAGKIVSSYGGEPGGVSATVEYAVAVLGVTDIVICGHSDCGAMTAIATHKDLRHLPAVADGIDDELVVHPLIWAPAVISPLVRASNTLT